MADAAPPKTPTTPRSIRAKLGRPRAPVPVSIWPSDPLWDEARNLGVAEPRQSGPSFNEPNTSTSARSGGQPADGTLASSSMAPPLPTTGQQSSLSHPATATVPGRAGSRVQNLLARMQTQVQSRSVQRTVVDLNVRGRVQQVAANHGGFRSSTYFAGESTSPELVAAGGSLVSPLPNRMSPSTDQDSNSVERSRSPTASGSGSVRSPLLPVSTTTSTSLPEPAASSPPPRPSLELDMSVLNRPLPVEAQPALPDQDSSRQPASSINVPVPTSAVDASTSTAPRRRMRADHLARCINLQHGMLRESRIGGSDGNDDLLTRLSMYEDSSIGTFSPGGLLRAAEALDARLAMARRLGALAEGEESHGQLGPMTAPVFATGRRGHLRAASDLPSLRVPPPTRRIIAEQGFTPIAVSRSSTLPTDAPAAGPSYYSALEPEITLADDERLAESPEEDLGDISQVPSPVEEKNIFSAEVSRDARMATPKPETLAATTDSLSEQDDSGEQPTNHELVPSPPLSTARLPYLHDAAQVDEMHRLSPNPIDSDALSTPVTLVTDLHPALYSSQLRVSPVRHFDGPTSASADSDAVDPTSPAVATNQRHDSTLLSPVGSDMGIGLDVDVPFTFDGDLRTARASAVPSSAGFRASFLPGSSAPVDDQLEEEFAALTARSAARGAFNSPSSSPSSSLEDLGEELPHDFTDMPFTFPDADAAAKARRVSAVPSSAGFRNSFFFHGVPTSTELEDEYAALRDAWHHGDSDEDGGAELPLDLVDEPASALSPALELADAQTQTALSPRSMRSGRSSSTESRELERLRQSAYEAEFSPSPGPTPMSASMSYSTSRPSSYMPTTAGFSEFNATPHSIAFSDVERTLDEVAPARPSVTVQPDAIVEAPAAVESPLSPITLQSAFPGSTSAGSRLTFSSTAMDSEHVFSLSPSLGSALDSGEHSAWPYSPTTSSWAHGTDATAMSLEAQAPPVPDVRMISYTSDEQIVPNVAGVASECPPAVSEPANSPLPVMEASVPRVIAPSSTSSPSSASPVFEPPFTATSYSLSPYVTEESFEPLGTAGSDKLSVSGSSSAEVSQNRHSNQHFLDTYHTEAAQRGSQLGGAPWTGVGYSLSPYLRTPAPEDTRDEDDPRAMARDENEPLPSAYFRSPGPSDSSHISAGDRLVHQSNEVVAHRHDDEALPSPYMHSPTGGQTFGAASGLASTSTASPSSRPTPPPSSPIRVNVDVAQHDAPTDDWSISHRLPSTSLALPPLSPNSISFPTTRSRPESGSSLQLPSRPPSGSPLASPAPSTSFSHETAQIGLAVLVSVAPPLPTTFSALDEIFGRHETARQPVHEQAVISPDESLPTVQRSGADELVVPRVFHTKAGSMERLHRSKASIDLLIRTPRREPDVPHTPLPPTPLAPSQIASDTLSEESASPPPPPPKTQSVLRMAQRIQEAKQLLQDEEYPQITKATSSSSTSASNSVHRPVTSDARSGQTHQNEVLSEADALHSDSISTSPTTNAIYVAVAPLGSPDSVPSPTSSPSSVRSTRANAMPHGESPVHIQTFTASATTGTSVPARPRAKTTTGPIRAFHRPTPLPRSKSNSPLVPGVQAVQDSASPPPPLQSHYRVPQSVKFTNPWHGREQPWQQATSSHDQPGRLQPWQTSATQHHQRNASLQPVSPTASSAWPSAVRGLPSLYAPRHSQSEQSLRTRALLGALGSPFTSPHTSLVASASSANKLAVSPTSPSEGSQASTSSITPPAGKTSLSIPPPPVLPSFAATQADSSGSKANVGLQTASAPANDLSTTTYFDAEDEDDALDQLKREMMEWQIGVASAWSDGVNKPAATDRRTKRESLRLAPDTPMKFVFEHREHREQKQSAKVDMTSSKAPFSSLSSVLCDTCGHERESGECIIAHLPVNGGGYKSSSSSNAGSAKPLRPSDTQASVQHHGSSRSQANGATKGSRRNSFERLYTALYAAPAASTARNHIRNASADTRPSIDEVVTRPRATTTADDRYRQARPSIDELMSGHGRTPSVMSGMSSMSTASSFFSSDLAEMGRSRSANAIVTRPPPAGPRIPLKHAASLDSSVVKGQRQDPPESVVAHERFANADRFAAHVARFGSTTGSDSTHMTASSGSTRQMTLQHSTFIGYATVNSVESAGSSVPSTPADSAVDWEHAFGIHRQQSHELLSQGSTAHTARDNARDGRIADENARNSSRWSEDSTHRAAMLPSSSPVTTPPAVAAVATLRRERSVLTKQPSRTNLNASSPSLVPVPRSGSVTNLHSMYETASPSPSADQAPWSAAGGTFGGAIARRLRLKSLPGKPTKAQAAPSAFTFSKLVGKKTSTEELRSGWIG